MSWVCMLIEVIYTVVVYAGSVMLRVKNVIWCVGRVI